MSESDSQQQQEQHVAARNLIAQMVSNSDLHGDDVIEEQRRAPGGSVHANASSGASDEAVAAAAARQAELQRRQEAQYAPLNPSDADAAQLSAADPQYRDEVQEAFDNYGQITQDILDEWKEMFQLFDFDNTGFIQTSDLGTVIRGLGRNLTEESIGTLVNSYDANGSGALDFPTFYTLMVDNAPMPGPCFEAQVLRDFHVFDTYRTGTLPVADLVHLLRNLGEPLTRDDVDHLLQEIYIDGDQKVNIKDLVQHMFRTSAPNTE